MSSYIQKMMQNPINTFEISIYNTKHNNNTTIYFPQNKMFENTFKK